MDQGTTWQTWSERECAHEGHHWTDRQVAEDMRSERVSGKGEIVKIEAFHHTCSTWDFVSSAEEGCRSAGAVTISRAGGLSFLFDGLLS
jgi:hypothetical protein